MFILSSRSATVLVIFIVACIAFCLASVFGAMTGPISILPNESSGGVLDNLSAITDTDGASATYGYDDSQDYQSSSYDTSSDSQVETTTDDSSSSTQDSEGSTSSSVETTTDDSTSNPKDSSGFNTENPDDN